jgi:PTH1 family peptidyl-tRNA hydrolase
MPSIKAIIGLGNPGPAYTNTRHNIGFAVLDALAEDNGLNWRESGNALIASLPTAHGSVLLLKPQTFMNSSGAVIPSLAKKGIKPEEIVVIHDELELPFGKVAQRLGGSAKGHNGLRSLIAACGDQFHRLRIGIGRPERKEDVGTFVLAKFSEPSAELQALIARACDSVRTILADQP